MKIYKSTMSAKEMIQAVLDELEIEAENYKNNRDARTAVRLSRNSLKKKFAHILES